MSLSIMIMNNIDVMKQFKESKNYKLYSYEAKEVLNFSVFVCNGRKRLKLSQQEFASKAETTQAIISKIERGYYNTGIRLVGRIKYVLRIDQ